MGTIRNITKWLMISRMGKWAVLSRMVKWVLSKTSTERRVVRPQPRMHFLLNDPLNKTCMFLTIDAIVRLKLMTIGRILTEICSTGPK